MSSFYDQLYSEIDAARKLVAGFANRHRRKPVGAPLVPSAPDRQAQEESAAAEIAALAGAEERLAKQARERAEHRAKARADENAKSGGAWDGGLAPEQTKFQWNGISILKGLAKLRIQERSAAEELIRKAHEVREEAPSRATDNDSDGRELGVELHAAPVHGRWSPSLGASQVWFFTSRGTRCGPVTFGELRIMAVSRVLDPRLDMVWKEGMDGWKQAGLLDGLFERRNVSTETADGRGGKKLRMVAALPKDLTAALASKRMCWPGAGRRLLWFGILLFPMLWSQLLKWSNPTLVAEFGGVLMSKLLPIASYVPVVVLIYLILMRLVNLGMSRWWALVLAIPVLNLWVGFRCLVCPAGYAYHRKMDRSGMGGALAVAVIVPAAWHIIF